MRAVPKINVNPDLPGTGLRFRISEIAQRANLAKLYTVLYSCCYIKKNGNRVILEENPAS